MRLSKGLYTLTQTCTQLACAHARVHAGFTHLQPAMTVRWSHWLMCHAAAFQRDDMRLKDLMPRVATSPLGSGALAGNPFGVDRQFIAQELGMALAAHYFGAYVPSEPLWFVLLPETWPCTCAVQQMCALS
eukprot:scaffold137191_cov30-Tisochrysis_lutea.AAC.1